MKKLLPWVAFLGLPLLAPVYFFYLLIILFMFDAPRVSLFENLVRYSLVLLALGLPLSWVICLPGFIVSTSERKILFCKIPLYVCGLNILIFGSFVIYACLFGKN